jgi:hypothetical protein
MVMVCHAFPLKGMRSADNDTDTVHKIMCDICFCFVRTSNSLSGKTRHWQPVHQGLILGVSLGFTPIYQCSHGKNCSDSYVLTAPMPSSSVDSILINSVCVCQPMKRFIFSVFVSSLKYL